MNTAILLVSCPDQKGITAKISNFIYQHGGNIEHADQHIDSQTNTFFMRIEWSLDSFKIAKENIVKAFSPLAAGFKMNWSLHASFEKPQMAVFVSRYTHCLYDLLLRYKSDQLNCHIPCIISNHPVARPIAKHFGIEFFEFKVTKKNKRPTENRTITLLEKKHVEIIVLARYTQILTKQFVEKFPNRVINIHHSFLPAFVGRKPYEKAYRRGVKIIGATSHYVTEQLDRGPIIEQDTVRVSHRDTFEDLKRKGEDLEKVVLNRAVRWHLERKVLAYNNKTVVFD
ncbi:MAG: formyltetrahydrofolate deformylase [Candidatus Omnitrophota bacterium]